MRALMPRAVAASWRFTAPTFTSTTAAAPCRARRPSSSWCPGPLSRNTIATALLVRHGDAVWIGIDVDDLPAAQGFTGNSELYVTPAWRLPHELTGFTPALAWIRERLREEYGLEARNTWQLGGPCHPWPPGGELRAARSCSLPRWGRCSDFQIPVDTSPTWTPALGSMIPRIRLRDPIVESVRKRRVASCYSL